MTNTLFECFIAAAETLNFTIAAQKLHITQPAFSRNIAVLEDDLGFPLFLRSKKTGVRITPAGLAIYNGLKKLEREYAQILDEARRIKRGEEGKLVVGVLIGVHMDENTASLIRAFQTQYPHVEVLFKSYKYGDLLDSVESGACDVCFALADSIKNRTELLHDTFYCVESYLVVPARLHCDQTVAYQLKEFENEIFLLSEDAPEINDMFVEACRQGGFEPKTRMAPDYETKMLWVELGLGVAGHGKDHYTNQSPNVDFLKVEGLRNVEYTIAWQKENYNPAIALLYSMFS